MLKDGADPKATALAWLKANPDAVKPWLEGVTTFDGGDAAAAVAGALATDSRRSDERAAEVAARPHVRSAAGWRLRPAGRDAMDPISKFLADWKIPVGQWGKAFIDFIIEHFQWFFDAISAGLHCARRRQLADLLLLVPPLLLAALARRRSPTGCSARSGSHSASLLGLLFILNQGLWKETVADAGAGRQRGHRAVDGDRRAARHLGGAQAAGLAHHAAGPRPDADDADLRLSHPDSHPLRPWERRPA